VLTDGVARLVGPFRVTDWDGLLDILTSDGPRQLLRQLRRIDASDPQARRWPRYA
jgi:hypothetical protein